MKSRALYLAAASFLIAFYAYYAKLGESRFIFVTDLLALLYALFALIFGVHAMRGKQDTDYYAPLLLILSGVSLWCFAELLWLFFSKGAYLLVESLRLIGYLPMLCGFFFILRTVNPKFFEQKSYLLLVLVTLVLLSVVSLILAPVFSGQLSFFDSITVNGYILADVTLLIGIGLLIYASYRYRGTFLSLIWVSFALAYLCIFMFDLMFSTIWHEYYFGHPFEILILASYVMMALGFYFYHVYCKSGGKDEAYQ